jgi:hypothetical protein
MQYNIKKLEKILENGVEVKQLLTLEVVYDDETTSEHGKYISLEADPKEEAIIFSAELSLTLKDKVIETKEEVPVAQKDKAIKAEHIEARLEAKAEEEAIAVDLEEPIKE